MKITKCIGIYLIISLSIGYAYGQENNFRLIEKAINSSELSSWSLLGKGEVSIRGVSISLQKADDAKGIMLVSPQGYANDVIVRYKTLALTPATVLVAFLSVSDLSGRYCYHINIAQ